VNVKSKYDDDGVDAREPKKKFMFMGYGSYGPRGGPGIFDGGGMIRVSEVLWMHLREIGLLKKTSPTAPKAKNKESVKIKSEAGPHKDQPLFVCSYFSERNHLSIFSRLSLSTSIEVGVTTNAGSLRRRRQNPNLASTATPASSMRRRAISFEVMPNDFTLGKT